MAEYNKITPEIIEELKKISGDRVMVGSKSGLDKNVPDGEIRFGYPALPGMQYHRAAAVFKRLPELDRTVRQLEKDVNNLKNQ